MGAQYKQIGNAVPVNLSYHIGRCLIAMLNRNYNIENVIIEDNILDVKTLDKAA